MPDSSPTGKDPDGQGSYGSFFKSLPRETLKKAIIEGFLAAVVAVFSFLFLKSAAFDTFPGRADTIDIHLKLEGRIQPGDRIEIFPPSIEQQLSSTNEIWYRNVDFNALRGRDLEIRRVERFNRTTLFTLPIDQKPIVDIHREVK
jgi:hypothetical protein